MKKKLEPSDVPAELSQPASADSDPKKVPPLPPLPPLPAEPPKSDRQRVPPRPFNAGDALVLWKKYSDEEGPEYLRFVVALRLQHYLNREYEATGEDSIAWEAYQLARQHSMPVPEWVLEFLDGLASAESRKETPQRSESGSVPKDSRTRFEAAAWVVSFVAQQDPFHGTQYPHLAELGRNLASPTAILAVANRFQRSEEWVADCYEEFRAALERPFRLKARGREFFSSKHLGRLGGKASAKRRKRCEGILAAICIELERWRTVHDELPTIEQLWKNLQRASRDGWLVEDRWRISAKDGELHEIDLETGESRKIKRASFPRYYRQVKNSPPFKKS